MIVDRHAAIGAVVRGLHSKEKRTFKRGSDGDVFPCTYLGGSTTLCEPQVRCDAHVKQAAARAASAEQVGA